MNRNDVWAALEIEPTKDKRTIKQAYARAVKKYHPEENPEEFQRVYTAYKQAMAFAESGRADGRDRQDGQADGRDRQDGQANGSGPESERDRQDGQENGSGQQPEPESSPAAADEKKSAIEGLFHEMQGARAKKLDEFRSKWKEFLVNQNDPFAEWDMRQYVASQQFLDIMEEPEVIGWLITGIKQCPQHGKALKEDIWMLYDLDHLEKSEGKAERLGLYHTLSEDPVCFFEKSPQVKAWEKEDKKRLRKKRIARVRRVVFLVLLLLFVGYQLCRERPEVESALVKRHLETAYPALDFTVSMVGTEETAPDGYDKGRNYSVITGFIGTNGQLNTFEGTATVAYKGRRRVVIEDLGTQYVQMLAEDRGLSCELLQAKIPADSAKERTLLVGEYTGEGDLAVFAERFYSFVRSDEIAELTNVEGYTFCAVYCDAPDAFFGNYGGMPQTCVFATDKLPAPAALAQQLQQQLAEYYIYMEPWSVEDTSDYKLWLEQYRKKAERMKKEAKTEDGKAVAALAEELKETVLVYEEGGMECISVGDVYRMAKCAGMDCTVEKTEDGYKMTKQAGGGSIEYTLPDPGVSCYIVRQMFSEDELQWQ